MEEDIKILEEQLNAYKRHLETYEKEDCLTSVYYELKKYATALENLIKGYRELDKKNTDILEKLITERMVTKVMSKNIKGYQEALENSIPKSKVKELKEENEKRIDEMRPYKHQAPFDFGVLNGIDECCRKLLEDK